MAGARFTTWLGDDERQALRALAKENHVSENFVVRLAIRNLLFGQPLPTWLTQPVKGRIHVKANR